MVVLHGLCRCMLRGGCRWGVFLSLVLQWCGRSSLLQDALVWQVGHCHIDIGCMRIDTLGRRQRADDGLRATQLDGSVKDIGAEL